MTVILQREIGEGRSSAHPIRRFLRRSRAWVDQHPRLRWLYRTVVGVLGSTVAVIGLILVPLPGPGWLVVFLGIAILGTEFPTAHRIAVALKRILTTVWAWWRSRRARASAGGSTASAGS
ncbi:TIGR02611 family protein [Cryobacterium sp. M25]|uniref:TIGR02611 family protein n=1 Tax=Cryobacterium sp. M25 TaxID=2048293 RepID=UPI000CE4B991|nr:TIGR02611 family protein [Cryobacterium sp. M25]